MGPTKQSSTQIQNTHINEQNIQNVQNHQTSTTTNVSNQDYLKEVDGDRVGGSKNTFNGLQNAGYQCFGATCGSLQELGLFGGDSFLGGHGGILGGHGLVDNILNGHGDGLTSVAPLGLQQLFKTGAGSYYHPAWMTAGAPQPLGKEQVGTYYRVAYTPEQLEEASKMLSTTVSDGSKSLYDFETAFNAQKL